MEGDMMHYLSGVGNSPEQSVDAAHTAGYLAGGELGEPYLLTTLRTQEVFDVHGERTGRFVTVVSVQIDPDVDRARVIRDHPTRTGTLI